MGVVLKVEYRKTLIIILSFIFLPVRLLLKNFLHSQKFYYKELLHHYIPPEHRESHHFYSIEVRDFFVQQWTLLAMNIVFLFTNTEYN